MSFVVTKVVTTRQKYACHNKTFAATNIFLLQQTHFCCNKHIFVATKVLSKQAYVFCGDRSMLVMTELLSRQTHLDKTIIATKMILVAMIHVRVQ